jgi:predicted nucleic acid-binding protein
MALILDTGPTFAILDRNDDDHERCVRLIEGTYESLVIPAPVLVEVDYWIQQRLRPDALIAFLQDIRSGGYRVEDLVSSDYDPITELCSQYADSDIGFVDAAVLAVVERLDEPKLATLDRRHFGMLRPRHTGALQLLPD